MKIKKEIELTIFPLKIKILSKILLTTNKYKKITFLINIVISVLEMNKHNNMKVLI